MSIKTTMNKIRAFITLLIFLISNTISFEQKNSKDNEIFLKFENFLKTYKKSYSTINEYIARYRTFKGNYEKMVAFSLEKPRSFKSGITKFSDLTQQEFRNTYLNLKISLLEQIKAISSVYELNLNKAPEEFDWRKQGAVGPVKDQGACGSCWAFSTVANLEGIFYKKHKANIVLAEQQLVDCDKTDSGCNGGLMENAFEYVKEKGLALAKDYKYRAKPGECKEDKVSSAIIIKGSHFAPDKDEENIKKMLVETGPLSIAINADLLQFYQEGIVDVDVSDCDPSGLNHGVAVVGYGSEDGKDYWIIRNSWGDGWGEKGYVRFALGKGVCGVNSYVITAELD